MCKTQEVLNFLEEISNADILKTVIVIKVINALSNMSKYLQIQPQHVAEERVAASYSKIDATSSVLGSALFSNPGHNKMSIK